MKKQVLKFDNRIEELLVTIEQSNIIKKYRTEKWLPNGNYVWGITHYKDKKQIKILVESNKNVFTKFMQKIYYDFNDIVIDKYYWTSEDGSPNEIIFYLR